MHRSPLLWFNPSLATLLKILIKTYLVFLLIKYLFLRRANKELEEIERQINERKENALRLVGTQDDAICQICQKTKFADGIGHKCYKVIIFF